MSRWPDRTVDERFDAKVDVRPDGCHIWTGTTNLRGYGLFYVSSGRRKVTAHRYAMERATGGPIPAEMVVCHACDTPPCVNPEHLFLGSQSDNLRDMVQKTRHPRQKLDAQQVAEILDRYQPFCFPNVNGIPNRRSNARELAAEFGVTPNHIKGLATGRGHYLSRVAS